MNINSVAPVLLVDRIEPVLGFWEGRLGLKRTAEVPHGDGLGFVMYEGPGYVLMYQTYASGIDDLGAGSPAARLLETLRGSSQSIFVTVDDIDAVERALEGVPRLVPRRKTFYGATEVTVRDPAGHLVTFAQFEPRDPT